MRDRDRLSRALEGIDTVVHAAALKQVPAVITRWSSSTQMYLVENIVQACLDTDVKHVVALSTDKAAAPINLYGATKLCSDKLSSPPITSKETAICDFQWCVMAM